ncbi:calcium/sodium antiporter [Yoonia sediminilitoris]|uniref:Cation:H+ antiporter n=1 Tax=Yoonia sediminilitoris TaxID=1286148 RepID=A0A2T6KS74_9RHOB|nr:calcium/sodium antiporter [Yoonia sediminilitoris]PUB19414.1 cation:H+ antiporter [Yoonia sediminilitoris]RCW99582.1 cation:H+ antiporter [Yoonia sediminilitoris]
MELPHYDLFVLAAGAILFGLFLLIKGGDWTIDAAVFMAERTGLSPLFIGATIVSFGTSVPELFASVNANLQGFPGIALGNVLGSNIANILLVLGATAFVYKIEGKPKDLIKDLAMMLLATALLVVGMLSGQITTVLALGMFVILASFVTYQYLTNSIVLEEEDDDDAAGHIQTMGAAVLFLLGGLLALAVGAEMLVKGAVVSGTIIGVPDAIIGMTVVAFGTSLPELSTCVAAARKRSVGLILGNIIGSNTFNILSIVALTALIKPLDVVPELAGFQMWATVAISVAFAVWMLVVGKVTKRVGGLMVVAYAVFIAGQYVAPKLLG